MKQNQVDFSNGRILQNMLYSALPMLLAQLLNLLYSIVDRIYIGQIPGEGIAALGGIGLCFPIISLITGFANWFGQGGAPLCSIARGRKDTHSACQIMNNSFYMCVAVGLVLTFIGYVFSDQILVLFGASGASLSYANDYLRIYILGTIFYMVSLGMNPFINSQGFAKIGMISVGIGTVLNLILDPIFIFYFKMDVQGAALATILSQMASCLYALWFLCSRKAELNLLPLPKVEWKMSRVTDILGLGFASFVMQATNSLVQVSCNSMLAKYGSDLYISVMTVINSIRQILDTPVIALSEGTSPVIGYNYGAGNYPGVRKAIRYMSYAGMGYTVVVWIFVMLFPSLLISVFSSGADFIEIAKPACRVYFGAFIFQTFQYAGQSTFKSLNKKKQAIFFSLLRKVVIVVPLTYLLPAAGLSVMGVFLAEPISNVVGGLACFLTMLKTVYFKLPEERIANQTN